MTTPLIRRLTLQNFLSYGPEGVSVDLLPLNVLIGPNASGKSNMLEALAILRAASGDLQGAIREGGGISEYLWKKHGSVVSAVLEPLINYPPEQAEPLAFDDLFGETEAPLPQILRHRLELTHQSTRLSVELETIAMGVDDESWESGAQGIYDSQMGPVLHASAGWGLREAVYPESLKPGQSILSQFRDPSRYPEITFLSDNFGEIGLFQEWNFGRRAAARLPQPTDLPSDFLLPDTRNLGLVLHDLAQTSAKREELISYLRRFYEPARYISTKIQGGTLQLYIEEEGSRLIPATRLSDGTLRYLCLLAILLHPDPPPVIGIEEPELGLHPDIMPTIAELLKKASERTQLFVTTHSDALVSALSDTPESILVCEGTPDGTTMKRLDGERLRSWLDQYTLGDIWRMGEIGGNRW